MKRFRFRLQRLLEIRQQETKVALNNFARARLATRAAAMRLEQAAARRAESAQRLLARRQGRMTVLEWRQSTELHEALVASDTALAYARADFNAAVAAYNLSVREFPTVLVAQLFGFRAAAAF